MNYRSIAFRLVLSYSVLLLIVGLVFAGYTYFSFNYYGREVTRNILATRAVHIWKVVHTAIATPAGLGTLIEQHFEPEGQNRFIRLRIGTQVLYTSGQPIEGSFDATHVPLLPTSSEDKLVKIGHLFLFMRNFPLQDGRTLTIESGYSTDFIGAAKIGLGTSLLVGLPILLFIAAVSGYVLIRRALLPVENMIAAAEVLTFNSPEKRLPSIGTGDRIDALGRALNRMLERFDTAYQHVSRFSADAAHELRTPLSIMRGELELAATTANLPPHVETALGNALQETDRLTQIIESLINLSRIDSLEGKRAHRPVRLDVLAEETIEQLQLLAEDKGITLQVLSGEPVTISADRGRFKQLLVNLLDNAVKYTPAGGRIEVEISQQGNFARICVTDNGVGIPVEHHAHIFDRFFRVTPDRGEVGAGLGLAIVKSICNAHGGQIALVSSPGKGSSFQVTLPRGETSDAGFATQTDSSRWRSRSATEPASQV